MNVVGRQTVEGAARCWPAAREPRAAARLPLARGLHAQTLRLGVSTTGPGDARRLDGTAEEARRPPAAGGQASQVRYAGFAADRGALKAYLDSLSGVGAAAFAASARRSSRPS
jgi:hypothetical protein